MGGCIGINRNDSDTINDSSTNMSRPASGTWHLQKKINRFKANVYIANVFKVICMSQKYIITETPI